MYNHMFGGRATNNQLRRVPTAMRPNNVDVCRRLTERDGIVLANFVFGCSSSVTSVRAGAFAFAFLGSLFIRGPDTCVSTEMTTNRLH